MTVNAALAAAIDAMPLVDHHVHSLLRDPLSEQDFLDALTEARHPIPRAATFDTQLGFAVRRHCAPLLGLRTFASAEEYLAARDGLGFETATSTLLRASGISAYLVDGGHRPDLLLPVDRMMELADAVAHPIVRLEAIAEAVMASARSGGDFLEKLDVRLRSEAEHAVGWKTVAAYRCGLDLDPEKPSAAEAIAASDAWFAQHAAGAPLRLVDRTLIRHLIWWALERGDVVQVHAGLGDPDVRLETANPAVMQRFVAATGHTGGRIVFLHCYPYVREAGFLANIHPHVFLDAGLAIAHLGANADSVVRETLDLAPFGKVLFSSDAWGLPELVYLGARLWRDAMTRILSEYIGTHGWPLDEAIRVAEMVARRNAETLYLRPFPLPNR